MQSLDESCSALNLQTANVEWSDETYSFPVYALAKSEITMGTTQDITSGSTNSLDNPISTPSRICEFFANALDINAWTYPVE